MLVTFSQTDKFDRSKVAKVADDSRGIFEGMPGLRFKCFTLQDDGVRARNFYLWDDEAMTRLGDDRDRDEADPAWLRFATYD